MAFRALLAGSALALTLAACSGGSDDVAEVPADDTTMASPVDAPAVEETAAPVEEGAAPEAAAEAEVAKEDTPKAVETAKPAAGPTKAAVAQAAAVVAAVPPPAFGRCAVCHTANKGGEDKLGPNLWGAYGAKAGQGSFSYSDALKNSGLTFDEATLHSWLENPRALVPGNRMSFPGIKDAAKRQEIIDYLKKQR
ncbi:cytochrome c family protein [Qipengyuania sp. RANM35]|uniref:c-type cytochrome n=1 Tax=Qipengyuania sp. RANM35 TaxID=3068635 RepID=UPI0034DAC90F